MSFHSQLLGRWSSLFSASKGLDVFAAWRVRPSGPDTWADALMRHIFPAALQAAIACSGDMDQDHCHAGIGTGGRLCSPNLRFWRPALSIELHPYMCASRLNCHTPHIGPDCGTLAQFSAGQRLLEGPEAEVNLRAEGKRSGSAEIRPHTPIFAYSILSESLTRES